MRVGSRVRHMVGCGVVVGECDEHPCKTFKVHLDGHGDATFCLFASSLTLESSDQVEAPSHYVVGGYECRKVIQALGLGWARGNAFAYLWRAGRKGDEATDIRKAIECLKFDLEQLEAKP